MALYRVLGDFPNTYVFTKCLAEDVVLVEGKGMPVVLYRPAIGAFINYFIP